MKIKGIKWTYSKLICISLFIFHSLNCHSQKEGNQWYFGYRAGLSFNSSPPKALNDSKIYQWEGCSSMSDESGNLLFYTDGITVWNKMHKEMENGTNLFGHYSSTQSALIVKKPKSNSIYYIFTTNTNDIPFPDTPNLGVCYSIVDLSINNGEGKLVLKNAPILPSLSTEKITAVKHANKSDIWIITAQYTSSFLQAFLLNENGINSTPITSKVPDKFKAKHGCLKASASGDLIGDARTSFSYVYKFNNETGQISEFLKFPIQNSYGVEFSQDQSKVYFSNSDNYKTCFINQFNLNGSSPDEIINSHLVIGKYPGCCGSTLQIGPDRKIYVAHVLNNYLGVISDPNKFGSACEYLDSSILLNGTCTYGLPNLVNDYYLAQSTSIKEISPSKLNYYSIYPNPSFNSSILTIKNDSFHITKIEIIGIDSKKIVYSRNLFENEIKLNISLLNPGIYFIRIYNESNEFQILKQIILSG